MPRSVFFIIGIACVGLGYIGAVTPLMPSTVFFLIALWAFKRSSPKFEDWLLNKSIAGPALRDWDRDRSMTLKTKRIAITMLWVSLFASSYIVYSRGKAYWVIGLLILIGISLTVFMACLKTTASDSEPTA